MGEESRACDDAAHSDSGRGCRGCHRQSQCRGAVSSHAAASCGPRRKWGVAAAAEVHSGVEARGKSTPRAPTTCAIASTCCCVVGGVRRESRAHRSSCCWPRRAAAKQQRAANSASHATQQEEPLEPQHTACVNHVRHRLHLLLCCRRCTARIQSTPIKLLLAAPRGCEAAACCQQRQPRHTTRGAARTTAQRQSGGHARRCVNSRVCE